MRSLILLFATLLAFGCSDDQPKPSGSSQDSPSESYTFAIDGIKAGSPVTLKDGTKGMVENANDGLEIVLVRLPDNSIVLQERSSIKAISFPEQ